MPPLTQETTLDPPALAVRLEADSVDDRLARRALDEAYERHQRLQPRGPRAGTVSLLVLAVMLLAAAVMVADYGSFGAAGAAVDRMIALI
ncbi:MAG: hypothetical protein P4L73_18575 [Caulobacteraceae bacterium]|nr:hypothetical protein [Caulobacteraceae bacterium]